MSNVLSNPGVHAGLGRRSRPVPVGVGLAIGAAASIGMWGAIIWSAVALLT